jgi:hypothetical protein
MFCAVPQTRLLQSMQIKFLSAGEWVEVEPDISPGWNSEGGIGVITLVTDGLADVKYVWTRWVEKLIPLRRLTTIIMSHRGPAAGLRPSRPIPTAKISVVSDLRSMSAIQLLKYGIEKKIYKAKGWILKLLLKEGCSTPYHPLNSCTGNIKIVLIYISGLMEDARQCKKERCWSDYKSQQLYIKAMREAKEDPEFDPRRIKNIVKNNCNVPKKTLTVQYLCHAYSIPYATLQRWKAEAFVSKPFEPDHKGKTVLTCNK